MKLLRLKITDPAGFRSLPCDFEHRFRSEWTLQEELAQPEGFAPFVCAGPNGSGKSNLLEALAAIFFHMECIYLENRPDSFDYDEQENPKGFRGEQGIPDGFEVEYLIRPPNNLSGNEGLLRVRITKDLKEPPQWHLWDATKNYWEKLEDLEEREKLSTGRALRRSLLPDYILGYSSGENEILSLPFFKMRFVQFDEYWNALTQQLSYPGHPETRLTYLDNGFSQAILLCNLLFQDEATLQPFRKDVGIESLKEFRIILRRSIALQPEQLAAFASEDQNQRQSLDDIVKSNPVLLAETDEMGGTRYRLNLLQLLEGDEKSSLMVSALKRCSTLSYVDEATDTLILDYWVNDDTKKAFRENFDNSSLVLFQAFQVLLTLNLYAVSDALKADLYQSPSHYVSETVPTLASDQRIMRFKFVRFSKKDVAQPMMLKELSDGEHQLLHSLGLCLLFRNTNSLFLLDEPETHFNPDWRANFISRLRQCLPGKGDVSQEMLITTHTPFLISDSTPNKVMVFKKDKTSGTVSISQPDFNTLGASINKITMSSIFDKRETIGGYAQTLLEVLRTRFERGNEDKEALITEIHQQLGDSVEKVLLIKAILDSDQQGGGEAQS